MTKEEALKWIPILQAFAEGKRIEYKGLSYDRWVDVTKELSFQDISCYRIKPQPPTYRPWKPEEVPIGKIIIHKASNSFWLIGGRTQASVYIYNTYIPFSIAFETYTMEDGSPCGVLET